MDCTDFIMPMHNEHKKRKQLELHKRARQTYHAVIVQVEVP